MQAIRSWSGENKFFFLGGGGGGDGGLDRGIWTEAYGQDYLHDAIHWFLHKFKIERVDTLRAFKAAARLMCPATAPSLNPTAADIKCPFPNGDIRWMARLCQELPAYFARAEGVSFEAQWQHGSSGCQKVD